MFLTLMYHLIDDGRSDRMIVSRQTFESQLTTLAELGATFLRLEDVHHILDGAPAPARAVLLSFDDGYANTMGVAFDILADFAAPAVVAVCGGFLSKAVVPDQSTHLSREFATRPQLERWIESGRDVAGHSYSHPVLTQLPAAALHAEIADDKAVIEKALGTSLRGFVYPFGIFDERIKRVVAKSYTLAFADSRGSWPEPSQRLAVRRVRAREEWRGVVFRARLLDLFCECRGAEPARNEEVSS
jgi:peptidoglycan/xylan/chitin deacetylase (PgdA/CDA1 family)